MPTDKEVANATQAAVTALRDAILWPDQPHRFVDSGRTQEAKDGRVMRLCSVCGRPPNAGRHHQDGRPPRGPMPAEHINGRHPYVAGTETRLDARGYRMTLCVECGGPANSPRHRTITAQVSHRDVPPIPVGPGITDREAATAPTGPPATGRRTRTISTPTTPAEYVAAALAIDRILALPADLVSWRLRLRLADVRPLLGVPDYPVLGTPNPAPDAEPDPEAPPPSLVEDRPALQPKVLALAPASQALGIIRGIRSDRIKSLARRALEQGWDVSMTGSGHLRLAKGSQVIIGSTTAETGSGHGWGNLRAAARRAGLDVTGL